MSKPRLGYIGLGAMGMPMARHLLEAGYSVDIWARTPSKVAALTDAGATLCPTPAALAAQCDVVLLCVFDAAAVNDVVFGANGIAEGGTAEMLIIDHSTTHPERSRDMAARLKAETGMGWVDAPVSGGTKGAEEGALIVMAGGADADIARAQDITAAYAKRFAHMGPIGSGQASKVCNQMIIGATVAVWAEALNFAQQFGVTAADLPDCLAGGWADSAVAQDHAKRMARLAPDPVGHGLMQKDMDAALDMARITGSSMPVTAQVAELYRLVTMRTGESGQASLIRLYTDRPFVEE
jgi:3-hydroxyisobutyrate dehydrogenase